MIVELRRRFANVQRADIPKTFSPDASGCPKLSILRARDEPQSKVSSRSKGLYLVLELSNVVPRINASEATSTLYVFANKVFSSLPSKSCCVESLQVSRLSTDSSVAVKHKVLSSQLRKRLSVADASVISGKKHEAREYWMAPIWRNAWNFHRDAKKSSCWVRSARALVRCALICYSCQASMSTMQNAPTHNPRPKSRHHVKGWDDLDPGVALEVGKPLRAFRIEPLPSHAADLRCNIHGVVALRPGRQKFRGGRFCHQGGV